MEKKNLIYLASPYLHHDILIQNQRELRMRDLTAEIINQQDAFVPFSPIAYTAPLSAQVNSDFDWYNWDLQFLNRCDGMVIVKLIGWETSKGVKIELNHCMENKIPYAYSDPFAYNIIQAYHQLKGAIENGNK